MRPGRIWSAATLLFLCLLLAAGNAACGKKNPEGLLRREVPENATPEKIMLEGLNATDEVGSLHYIFEYAFIVPPTGKQPYPAEVRLTGEGDYDAATENARARLTWSTFNKDFDYVLYEGVQYFRPADGDRWYELPGESTLRIPSVSEIARNTAEYLDNFQKITRLQDETVDGRECYHIAMVPNFESIMEDEEFLNMIRGEGELDEARLAELERIKEQLKEASVNYEYWFDKEYLVLRRTLYNIEMVYREEGDQPPFTVKVIMEITFPLYNKKVEITRPENALLYKKAS